MPALCAECAAPTVWDDAAASDLCTVCGTLADPAQVVLTSQDWHAEYTQELGLRDPAAPNILKSRSNHTLAGQGQGLRDQKNALTMANFIKSLAVSLNAPGLTPRATLLFNQAKAAGFFRWGSRARTVAGACLSLALRESNRPDSIHDIALLLRCNPRLLSRTFMSLAAALKITTLAVDPSVYIATLQAYLSSILQEKEGAGGEDHQAACTIPSALLKSLRPISLLAVSNTAQSLGRTLSRTCPSDSALSKSSAASTACAIFLLSLEAESRDTLGSIGDLAKCLAARCHIGKGVVMSQYKAIQDQLALLVEKVPWLEGYRQKKGRAKVSKRLVVARGLKDVIRFSEEILQNTLLPEVELELSSEDGEFDWDDGLDDDDDEGTITLSFGGEDLSANDAEQEQPSFPTPDADTQGTTDDRRPAKRRKIHSSLDEASRFLLNPFSKLPATITSAGSASSSKRPAAQTPSQARPSSAVISKFPLTSYVLSTASLSSVGPRPPTRLQLLTAARGGSDEDAIRDEELFAEGELEGLLRKDEEVEVMRRIFDWGSEDESADEDKEMKKKKNVKGKGKRKRSGGDEGEGVPKKSRVNLEAFAKFMRGDEDEGANMDVDDDKDDDDDFEFSLLGLDKTLGLEDDDHDTLAEPLLVIDQQDDRPHSKTKKGNIQDLGEELVIQVDEWRPASPSGGGASFENRYEEEYD